MEACFVMYWCFARDVTRLQFYLLSAVKCSAELFFLWLITSGSSVSLTSRCTGFLSCFIFERFLIRFLSRGRLCWLWLLENAGIISIRETSRDFTHSKSTEKTRKERSVLGERWTESRNWNGSMFGDGKSGRSCVGYWFDKELLVIREKNVKRTEVQVFVSSLNRVFCVHPSTENF